MADVDVSAFARIRASASIFITLAGVALGMTLLFLGMRSVMEIGGACAEGGPYVVRQSCPAGVPGMMFGGIFGGIIFFGLYLWQVTKHHVPSLAMLAWPALFLSLGWNFLEFGLDPPIGTGLAWGWLICAAVFALMGGLPLLVVARPLARGFTGSDSGRGTAGSPPPSGLQSALLGRERVAARPASPDGGPSSAPGAADGEDLVGRLERLAAMRRSGSLTDEEFLAAKRRVIERGPA